MHTVESPARPSKKETQKQRRRNNHLRTVPSVQTRKPRLSPLSSSARLSSLDQFGFVSQVLTHDDHPGHDKFEERVHGKNSNKVVRHPSVTDNNIRTNKNYYNSMQDDHQKYSSSSSNGDLGHLRIVSSVLSYPQGGRISQPEESTSQNDAVGSNEQPGDTSSENIYSEHREDRNGNIMSSCSSSSSSNIIDCRKEQNELFDSDDPFLNAIANLIAFQTIYPNTTDQLAHEVASLIEAKGSSSNDSPRVQRECDSYFQNVPARCGCCSGCFDGGEASWNCWESRNCLDHSFCSRGVMSRQCLNSRVCCSEHLDDFENYDSQCCCCCFGDGRMDTRDISQMRECDCDTCRRRQEEIPDVYDKHLNTQHAKNEYDSPRFRRPFEKIQKSSPVVTVNVGCHKQVDKLFTETDFHETDQRQRRADDRRREKRDLMADRSLARRLRNEPEKRKKMEVKKPEVEETAGESNSSFSEGLKCDVEHFARHLASRTKRRQDEIPKSRSLISSSFKSAVDTSRQYSRKETPSLSQFRMERLLSLEKKEMDRNKVRTAPAVSLAEFGDMLSSSSSPDERKRIKDQTADLSSYMHRGTFPSSSSTERNGDWRQEEEVSKTVDGPKKDLKNLLSQYRRQKSEEAPSQRRREEKKDEDGNEEGKS